MSKAQELALGGGVLAAGLLLLLVVIPAEVPVVASESGQVSPAFFPRIFAWLLMALGAAHMVQHALRPAAERPPSPEGARRFLRALGAFAIGAVYAWALPRIGFLVSTALGFVGLVLFLGGERPWRAVVLALPFAWILQEMFGRLLEIPLPRAGWLE